MDSLTENFCRESDTRVGTQHNLHIVSLYQRLQEQGKTKLLTRETAVLVST